MSEHSAEKDAPVVGCPMCRERGARCNRHAAEKDAGLRDALVALLREYTAGAYMTLNQNREAMIRAGAISGSSGGDVIRAGLGDWPESFLTTRSDLVDDVREAVTPDA